MSPSPTTPRLIIHGGAGNITRENLPPKSWSLYEAALRKIHRFTSELLERGATALDAATQAVTLFEDCELFNCGKGAVCRLCPGVVGGVGDGHACSNEGFFL